ncbi:dihydrolipoyl dehydrogenase [Mesomycoplasma neurolyticum]|uniref:Thioredoxin reductase n=1 Tax=Mesomycoplasma neurolyticum TaxID=2120 RepID=A0A449A559_9BACT|nr:dihydrolipoyl dehydrogenase [Mesomycoplasma neurolyticum]VEU59385.1 thioredoxin reductase [Mesomycoplasma neurolyticum]
MKKFDIVILGAGPGGYTLASILAQNDKKVAIIEKNKLGGTCVNYGCIPTKTLINEINFLNKAKKHDGIDIDDLNKFYLFMKKRMNKNSETLQKNIKNLLLSSKVDIFQGNGHVINENTLLVNKEKIHFEKLIIATGSRARDLNIENANEMRRRKILLTSNDVLRLKTIPKSITIIGAGPISLEFAYILNSLKTKVTILETSKKIFSRFSDEVASFLKKWLIKNKINFFENVILKKFEKNKLFFQIDNEEINIKTDKYFAAIGRIPNINDVKNLNLELNPNKSIKVDNKMKTSVKNVYAIGDVNGLLGITTSAYKHGDIVAKDILGFSNNEIFDPLLVPNTIFINPELSFVGLNEQQLLNQNIEYVKINVPGAKLPRNYVENANLESFFELYLDKSNLRILGSTIALKDSSLLINHMADLIKQKKTIFDLQENAYSHPTLAEAFYYLSRNFVFRKK